MKKLCALEDFTALEEELSHPSRKGGRTIVIPASTCSQASGANDLIRIAKRERGFGKFEFRSRPGESANPLFRGFDRTTEETEGYDEPVMKWLLPSDSDTNWITAGFCRSRRVPR